LGQLRVVNTKTFEVQGYTQKGNIYLQLRKPKLAAEAYNKALAIYPNDIVVRYSLLKAYIVLNRPADAKQQVDIITTLAQSNSNYQFLAHRARAHYNIAERNFIDAAAELEQALILNPYEAAVHYELGAVYITLGKYKQALSEMEKMLALDPGNDQAQSAISLLKNYFAPK
jgi:tetratricopeptide (TPR) repeat protein